jgi:signal transduction histidine kinase
MVPANSNADGGSAAKVAEAASRSSSMPVGNSIESLEKENQELRRTSKYRSLFLSRLAHELRTPLTSILGFSEIMLSQEKLTEAQRSFCERIQSSAQQLQASLNQLSDLARLESGQTRLATEKISIAEAVRDVLPALARGAEKKRLKLVFDASEDLPALVSDASRVRQVIYNVVAHAIYRSPEIATITVRADSASDGIVISVRDSGDPISEPSRVGIIDADDNSSTGELGLSIARQNLEILGGSISAQNLESGGELLIHLPLQLEQSTSR